MVLRIISLSNKSGLILIRETPYLLTGVRNWPSWLKYSWWIRLNVLNDRPVSSAFLTTDSLIINYKRSLQLRLLKNALTFSTMYYCEDILLPLAVFLPDFGWFLLIVIVEQEVPCAFTRFFVNLYIFFKPKMFLFVVYYL